MALPDDLEIEEMRARLAFWRVTGVGPVLMQQCLDCMGSISKLVKAERSSLPEALWPLIAQMDWAGAEADLAWASQAGNNIIFKENSQFPIILKEIPSCPPLLFIKGDLSLLHQRQVAMVGSRQPSFYGLKATRFLVSGLAQYFIVNSGLALGIDAESHRAAMDAGGKTLAILAVGLDQVYPKRHLKLAEQIIESGGALVSEFPIGVKPLAMNFPRRNRLISGLSLGVVIVEANLPSGSLITAQYALEQGREVFAVPGSIFQKTSEGCHALIKQGAQCIVSAEEILLALGIKEGISDFGNAKQFERNRACAVKDIGHADSRLEHPLLKIIYDVPQTFDELLLQTQLSSQVLAQQLTELVLIGAIVETWLGYCRT